MPPSAPLSPGCGRQSVCEKYYCEHWVLSHSAHTANRCYSEKNKTQTYSKREHFSSSPYHEPQAPLGGLPLKTIQPLATWAEAWQAIPGVSNLVLGIIQLGYTLQFARRRPQFCSLVFTSVQRSNPHILHAKVKSFLAKGSVEMVSPAQSESGFYSRYFLVSKKDDGLRLILDLRHLNRALMKRPFRMITSKQIFQRTGMHWSMTGPTSSFMLFPRSP